MIITGQNIRETSANFHPLINAMVTDNANVVIHWTMVATLSPIPSRIMCISLKTDTVSERLLFNANSAIVLLYHGKNKLIFNDMMSALY